MVGTSTAGLSEAQVIMWASDWLLKWVEEQSCRTEPLTCGICLWVNSDRTELKCRTLLVAQRIACWRGKSLPHVGIDTWTHVTAYLGHQKLLERIFLRIFMLLTVNSGQLCLSKYIYKACFLYRLCLSFYMSFLFW